MINDRLFKKINSIFWGIVSWLPIFLFLFMVISYSLTFDINAYGNDFNFEIFFNDCFSIFNEYSSFFTIETFFNDTFEYFLSLFTDDPLNGIPAFGMIIIIQINWFLLVQLIRLLVYVFMWFINLIYDLFDYLSLKRKGDN